MDGYVQIGTKLDTKSFDAEIRHIESQMEEIERKLKEADMGFEVGDTQKLEAQYSKLAKQLDKLQEKQMNLKKADLNNVEKSIERVGNSVNKTISKVSKWALAVFGVRSAYMAIRNAMDVISNNDEQLKADIEYIKNIFAYMLEPVVRKVVELVKQLLFYIGYISKSLTGKNIFENADKKLKNANKSAKELKKTLAGFDEMNVLADGGSGGGGSVSPSFNLSELNEADLSGTYTWLERVREIFDNVFDKIRENVKKVMINLGFSEDFITAWEFTVEGIKKIFDGLLKSIEAILEIIVGLVMGDSEKVKEGISNLIEGIKEMLFGLLKTLLGIFTQLLASLVDFVINPIKKEFISAVETIKNAFSSLVDFLRSVKDKVLGFFQTIGVKAGEIIGSAFKNVINGVLRAIENILNFPIKSINKLIDVINAVPGINLGRLPTFSLPRLAVGGVVNMPGRGINYMGANIGERGAEGVIPLTNSQMMETLGQAIGKYVTINANITNTMNGRVISRELQKVNSSSDFAFNR